MTPVPTPLPDHDHGAAGFCTDHAQRPDERTETVARLTEIVRVEMSKGAYQMLPDELPYESAARRVAAAVAAALDDETECSVCDGADEVRADVTRHAGWVEAMRFAHHAHASETSNGYPSANGVLGAGPDAVIVDGDWLAQVEANLAAARAALDRVRAVCAQIEAMPIPADPGMSQTAITRRIVATIIRSVRAALDPEEPR